MAFGSCPLECGEGGAVLGGVAVEERSKEVREAAVGTKEGGDVSYILEVLGNQEEEFTGYRKESRPERRLESGGHSEEFGGSWRMRG